MAKATSFRYKYSTNNPDESNGSTYRVQVYLDGSRLRVDDVFVGADGHNERVHLRQLVLTAILN
jgi:hypothetical protein